MVNVWETKWKGKPQGMVCFVERRNKKERKKGKAFTCIERETVMGIDKISMGFFSKSFELEEEAKMEFDSLKVGFFEVDDFDSSTDNTTFTTFLQRRVVSLSFSTNRNSSCF